MTTLANIVGTHDLNILSYANNKQLIISLSDTTPHKRNTFATKVTKWMRSTISNSTLTRCIWQDHLIMGLYLVTFQSWIHTQHHARNLRIIIRSKHFITTQVNAITASCIHILTMLRKIFK